MKLKLLLFVLLLSGGILNAQEIKDTVNYFIITESHAFRADQSYIELTNVGVEPVQLGDFRLGKLGPFTSGPFDGMEIALPEQLIQPGESYVIATFRDYTEKMYPLDPDHYSERITQKEMWDLADLQIHAPESNPAGAAADSVTFNSDVMTNWGGRDGWYLEQHLSDVDSVVVDQVGGVFDAESGLNLDQAYDVAGVTEATGNSVLVRKFSVQQGNLDFANARGLDVTDSEWIPIPLPYTDLHPYRSPYWTLGNHGDYSLDETTLVSSTLDVDFSAKTITAAWGTRNFDNFIKEFDQKPGIAWYYDLSVAREDSAYTSARTGDKITIYACGLDLDFETFDIVVAPPTADANIVMSKYRTQANGMYSEGLARGNDDVFKVTIDEAGMDTITNSLFGIGYATRVDSLFKYLEKAPKANWEIVWVNGIESSDLRSGDILKVTAENGDVKEYFIKVNGYRPNHNAYLSSITWPDVPEYLKGIFGWKGDTIPNFVNTTYNYKLQVPLDVDGIPALIAKTEQLNTKISVNRASSLQGTLEQQTITFTVTAEDDTTTNVYSVQLIKEKNIVNIQPYVAEPFLSELVFQDMWGNGFIEIANPGNQILDLSNYMFMFDFSGSPAASIADWSGVDQWGSRYRKYVPGYKWVSDLEWAVNPGTLTQDLSVSPLVFPGDVFVAGQATSTWGWDANFPGPIAQCDVLFNTALNPWGEPYDEWASACHEWVGADFYLFKILNDSVKFGLKAANDPADFELIEVFGGGDGNAWNIGGYNGVGGPQCTNFIRKPQYTKGKTDYNESFGTNQEDTEWLRYDPAYWEARGTGWPLNILNDTKDLGQHFMNNVTAYKSTVSSVVYKVSEGYKWDESIRGMVAGTTVSEFLGNIIKADENQSLKVKSMADGSELAMDAILSLNDTLTVLSADSTNISKYILEVSENGLSSNAVLTSGRYDIVITNEPKSANNEDAGTATIKGFEYGTSLKTVLANIIVPAGAKLDIVNGNGAYVSLVQLNFDTTYVNVTVNGNTFFDVTAENGTTEIIYQLLPDVSEKDAFITSTVYSVVQKDVLVHYVPRGTTAQTLLANLVPSAGASIKLVDKIGAERTNGGIADDDKVVVTSANGEVIKVYYLSMLAEEYIPETTYLAYINSKFYDIDQIIYLVDNVDGAETIAEFYSKITPSMGATAVVVDKDGNEKTSGDIDGSDMVKVTSADGKITVMYEFGTPTSTAVLESNNIELYPNPTNGRLNISGVEQGNRIQIYNTTGAVIRDINVQSNLEVVSLQGEPSGMYLIVVSNENELLGRFKAIKK